MLRLLQIEFIKLWNNRASKVLILSYFILMVLIAGISMIKVDFGPLKFHIADVGIFNFPYIWHFNTFMAAFLKLFLAIVIVSMIANEYSNKTIKQNLIDGLSKKELILSKFLTIGVFSLASTVFIFLISLILGLIYSDFNEVSIIFSDLEYLLAYFVKLIGFFSFCFFVGVLVKRSAFALGFLFIWFIGAEIIPYTYLASKYSKEVADSVSRFFPFGSMWSTITEPFSRLNVIKSAAQQVGEDISRDYSVQPLQLLIVLCWTTIFIYLSYVLLKKRDL
ncbi:ABC transporter permease [Cellulophaga fucicola]|uniref:ABC-type transport system involved in multi-copper enzyme maturation, permease component n=1 Tax=Cellulophaga fucicola TaxID=76595 RepID=A0A1K1N3K5_9FLAO|nr:ABC transporter permease subunit [Cellulophaga fucicola]SFW28902.1 ABC-type transport system involved in multi-copper enzyme maturation, permease component [Cellulophaga fucicola]